MQHTRSDVAWKRVFKVVDRVHARQPKSKKSPHKQEDEIARMVKAFRKHP